MTPSIEGNLQGAATGFEVRAGSTSDIEVTLWGDLGLGWFGHISMALARRGLNIRSAQATRRAGDEWHGVLNLVSTSASVDPYALDYLALASEMSPLSGEKPAIEGFRLERTASGALELRLSALDQIGLLAGLLDRCEFLGLFPERLRVATNGRAVDDTLWLRAVAGMSASAQAERALRDLLASLIRH